LQRAGSWQVTRQLPPGQSTLHEPVQVMSHRVANSQRTSALSPTVAVQRVFVP
jgi:hypothetical protein